MSQTLRLQLIQRNLVAMLALDSSRTLALSLPTKWAYKPTTDAFVQPPNAYGTIGNNSRGTDGEDIMSSIRAGAVVIEVDQWEYGRDSKGPKRVANEPPQ